jgi:hypothetical protein
MRIWALCALFITDPTRQEALDIIMGYLGGTYSWTSEEVTAAIALGVIGPTAESALPRIEEILARNQHTSFKDNLEQAISSIRGE